MDTIHSWLSELYDQVCKQMLTTGVPAHRNFGQQEKEIIQHFKEMWDDKQYDVYCLLVSVDDPDNLFTTDEPYALGAVVPYYQETEEMDYLDKDDPEEVWILQQDSDAYSESEDDGTTTMQENTDAEIQEAMVSVMISSDWDYWKLVGLSLEQSTAAMDAGWKAVEKIQTDNFEPDVETELTYLHSQRSESTQWAVKFKEDTGPDECHHQWEKTPERGGTWPKERGRSTVKHQTTSSRWTPERSLAVGYSTLTQHPGSLKRERTQVPSSSTPSGSMLTQSPAQKNTKLKLKSIVHKVPPKEPEARVTSGWQPDRALPYHSMAEKPEDFMNYIMQSGLIVRDHFIVEIDDLMIFSHEWSSITQQVVASILYTELAWFNGYPYTFPVIPPQLERKALDPEGAPLPERPKESRSHWAMGLKENCQVWWHYLLVLLQYWKDANSLFTYGGPLRRDSNLLMYVYHCIKCLLCLGKIELQHYSMKSQMPWTSYTWTKYMPYQIMKQRKTYTAVVDELQDLKNWLHQCYEAEADTEIRKVEQCGGDIRKISWPRVSIDLCPGNEDLYVALEKKETCPKLWLAGSEFKGGNSLARQWHQESKSMERQKYTLSQDECASPDMCITSPQPIDKSKVTQSAPVKKKVISVEEYHTRGQHQWAEEECKAAELKQKEKEETLCRQEEIRRMDQKDLEQIAREAKEREEKAQCTVEEELVWYTLQEEEAARAVESPPWDENDEVLDYYDDLDQDSEMASSSQGTVPMSSQDTAPASSQDTAPMSSQESKAAPASSQESATQDTNMPSLETATGTTILDTADETNMENETCLEGPTLKYSLQEERALLNPLLAKSLDHLEDVSLGYLTLIEACIHEIWRIRASWTPVASPRALPGLPALLPKPMLTEPAATLMLSEAIYSAASNLGTSVPHQTQRMPMHQPDQAETDQAMRVLEGINKAPGMMPDHSKPQTAPWWRSRKIESNED